MCDYSLHLVKSRPARVGDRLILSNFESTITRGFAALEEANLVVCLLPGTEVAFKKEIQCDRFLGLFSRSTGFQVACFRQVNLNNPYVHHDALEFPDGRTVTLQELTLGQEATVLQLPAHSTPQDAHSSASASAPMREAENPVPSTT